MLQLPPPVEWRAYLVGFWRSTEPGRYRDAGLYSEPTPTFTNGLQYDDGCDRSTVLLETRSSRSYGRARDFLLELLEQRPDLQWVKAARSFALQERSLIATAVGVGPCGT